MKKTTIAIAVAMISTAAIAADDATVVVENGTYQDGRCASVATGGTCAATTHVDMKGGTLVVDGKSIDVKDLKAAGYDDAAIQAKVKALDVEVGEHQEWLDEDKGRLNGHDDAIKAIGERQDQQDLTSHIETVERMAQVKDLGERDVVTNARVDDLVSKHDGLVERDQHLFAQQEATRKVLQDADAATNARVDGKLDASIFTADQARQDAEMVTVAKSVKDEADARRDMDSALKGAIGNVATGAKGYADKVATDAAAANQATSDKVDGLAIQHASYVEGQGDLDRNQWNVIERNKGETDAAIEDVAAVATAAKEKVDRVNQKVIGQQAQIEVVRDEVAENKQATSDLATKTAADIRYTQDVVDQYGQENDARVTAVEGTVAANDQAAQARDTATNGRVDETNEKVSRVNQKVIGQQAQIDVVRDDMAADKAVQADRDLVQDQNTTAAADAAHAAQGTATTAVAAAGNAQATADKAVAGNTALNDKLDTQVVLQDRRDNGQDAAIRNVGKGATTYTDTKVTEVRNYNTAYTDAQAQAARDDFQVRMEAAAHAQATRDAGQDVTINDARAVADQANARSAQNSQRLDAVEGRLDNVEHKVEGVKRGMAGLAAIQGIPENTRAMDNNVFGMGLGQYDDATAIAAGVTHHFNDHVVGKVGVGVPVQDYKQAVVNAGVAFGF